VATSGGNPGTCRQCGALASGIEFCVHCGDDQLTEGLRLSSPREVSAVERLMLMMLYVEDRETRWWDRPERAMFVAAAIFVGSMLWLSMS